MRSSSSAVKSKMNSSDSVNLEGKYFVLSASEEDPKRLKVVATSQGRRQDLVELLPAEEAACVNLLCALFNDEIEAKQEEIELLRGAVAQREQSLASVHEHHYRQGQQLHAELERSEREREELHRKMAEADEEAKHLLRQIDASHKVHNTWLHQKHEDQIHKMMKIGGLIIAVLLAVAVGAFFGLFVYLKE
ncbi:hypothetical protein QR680_006064 [Steinernema hermaphroditum]|uniref:Uncharacterized protein n=1 Tax=Steinernema hermaphroditum TaxID=289476 RepID=A0AA39LVX0_9BILA|nr:hypothetical protein QR680_006064 [Steinernema hermaphroditum]